MRRDETKLVHTQGHTLTLVCICLIALAGIHCGEGKDRAYSRGSTVIIAVSDITTLLPDKTDADFLVFLPLATLDENGQLEGRLAKSWEHSPDYREWTYHLRTDIRWHDGVPVTAHDLKFTLDLLSHPDILEYDLSATVLNDSTVMIVSSGEHRYQDDILYLPKHLLEHLEPKGFWDWQFWKRPVGNGPYRFVRYLPETMIEFEANPEYYRGKPKIERVVLKFVGDAGLTELLSGNVDAILDANPVQIPQLAADPRFHVYHQVVHRSGGGRAIYWHHDHPLFRDPRIRQALTLAINRRQLHQVLNLPEKLPIFDVIFTFRQYRRGEIPRPLPYDPGRSKQLLDAAGWCDTDGDGVRAREGQPFRFTAIVGDRPGARQMAVYVQDQLRQVGVHMEVQILDHSHVWVRMRAGEFEAAFFLVQEWPGFLRRYFGRDSPIGYKNPEVVKLIDQALATIDPDAIDQIYRMLWESFRRDLPVTFLHPWTWTFLVHRRIKGLSEPFRADLTRHMEDLWLEEED